MVDYLIIILIFMSKFFWWFFFQQRYWQCAEWYVKNGPVFLMIGGEGPEGKFRFTSSSWASHIKKYKAMAFLLEHRFYGGSKPFEYVITRISHVMYVVYCNNTTAENWFVSTSVKVICRIR